MGLMDLKKYGMRPYLLFSLAGVITFGVLWLCCMLYDPQWSPLKNSISDLSVSPSAPIFTTACVLTSILFAMYGIGKVIFEGPPQWVAGVAFVLGSVGLCSMSFFSKEFYDVHFITAAAAIAAFATGIILTMVGHAIAKRKKFFWIEIGVCLLLCLSFPLSFGMAQSLALLCIGLWTIVEIFYYKEYGYLDVVVQEE